MQDVMQSASWVSIENTKQSAKCLSKDELLIKTHSTNCLSIHRLHDSYNYLNFKTFISKQRVLYLSPYKLYGLIYLVIELNQNRMATFVFHNCQWAF